MTSPKVTRFIKTLIGLALACHESDSTPRPWYSNSRSKSQDETSDSSHAKVMMVNDDRKSRNRRKKLTVDSGASVHCINDKSLFETVYEDHPPVDITVANKQKLTALAVGTVRINLTSNKGETRDYILHNVVYHPSFSENLLSVRRLWKDSHLSTHFASTNRFVDKRTGEKFKFDWMSKGYNLEAYSTRAHTDPQVLHSRFGHCSERRLNKLRERSTNFPNYPHDKHIPHDPLTCDACQRGGMKRKPYGKRPKGRYTYFGEKLSSD